MNLLKFAWTAVVMATIVVCQSWTADAETVQGMIQVDEDYRIIWTVDPSRENPNVTFDLTVRTLGFIGFGLAPKGSMEEADIVTGGVTSEGEIYLADRWSTGHRLPKLDDQQDWHVLTASENATHTRLTIYRALDTGDVSEDLPIRNETTRFIWAWGIYDDVGYHGGARGTTEVNILSP